MSALALSERSYRWVDRASKLAGIGLIAAGLEVGGDTLPGVALAGAGLAVGLATVFITKQ